MRLRSLGDLVLSTPGIAALHAWRPDLKICVLVEPRFAAVFEGNPAVSDLLFSRGFLETARQLRRRKFPVVFNQHGGPRSALLTAASGSPVRVGWAGFQFSFLYTTRVPGPNEMFGAADVHTVEHRISQLYWTGLPRGPIPPAQVFPRPDAREAVAKRMKEWRLAPKDAYAVLQPGARFFTMRWAIEKFAELARGLLDSHGIVSIVNLGMRDEEVAADVRQKLHKCAIVPDPLPLRELIALIAGARLFVGNDSGPAHIAAATGRPTVVIFGSTSSVQWRPWQTAHRMAQNDFPCNPCKGDRCYAFDEPRCILSVSIEQVREACEDLLGSQSSREGQAASPGWRPVSEGKIRAGS